MDYTEMRLQMAIVEYCDWMGYTNHNHSPNEGKRTPKEGDKLKAMGMSAGYPDLELCYARCGYHGLYIEFKTKTGRASEAQKKWLEHLNAEGYLAVICRSFDEARETIDAYMNGRLKDKQEEEEDTF